MLCHIGRIVSYPFFIDSLYALVGMCFDRLCTLGDPLLYRIRITFRVSVGMVTYPWVHAATFGLGTGLGIDVKYDLISKDCGLGLKKRHTNLSLFLFRP